MLFDYGDLSGGGGNIEGYLHDGKFYVDNAYSAEIVGEKGLIYEDLSSDKLFRYSNQGFVEIIDANSSTLAMAMPHVIIATLAANNWSSNTQSVSITGMTTTSTIISAPDKASLENYSSCGVELTSQAAGSITFTCETVPTTDLTVKVIYWL